MLPVAGRPVLEHVLAGLARQGVTRFHINLHHAPGPIRDHFGDGGRWGVSIRYWEEERLLGTAGAVRAMEEALRNGPFLVAYGDTLRRFDLAALRTCHRQRRAEATLLLYEAPPREACGRVELDAGGRVTRFLEKPGPGLTRTPWANAGLYLLEPAVLARIPGSAPSDFARDVFPAMVADRARLYGHPGAEAVQDIGTPERYRRAETRREEVRHEALS